MSRYLRQFVLPLLALSVSLACSRPVATPQKSNATQRGTSSGGSHDLGVDEARGGHTLRKHVGRTDNDLRERLRRESGISAASTYTDRRTAENFVGECLTENQGRVMQWTRSEHHQNLALDCVGDPAWPIGRSLRRGSSHVEPCSNATVVLKFEPPEGYYVLTSYPDCR